MEKAQNLFDNIGKDTGFDSKYGLVSIPFSFCKERHACYYNAYVCLYAWPHINF